MKADSSLLSVEDVSFDYPLPRQSLFAPPARHRVLEGITLDLKAGESLGIVE